MLTTLAYVLIAAIMAGGTYAIVRLLPINDTIKQIAYIVIILAFAIWLLQLFLGHSGTVNIR